MKDVLLRDLQDGKSEDDSSNTRRARLSIPDGAPRLATLDARHRRAGRQLLRRGSKDSALSRSIASRSTSDICVCRSSSIIAAAFTNG